MYSKVPHLCVAFSSSYRQPTPDRHLGLNMVYENLPVFGDRLDAWLVGVISPDRADFYRGVMRYGFLMAALFSAQGDREDELNAELKDLLITFGDGGLYPHVLSMIRCQANCVGGDALVILAEKCGLDHIDRVELEEAFNRIELVQVGEDHFSLEVGDQTSLSAFLEYAPMDASKFLVEYRTSSQDDMDEAVSKLVIAGVPGVEKRVGGEGVSDFDVVTTPSVIGNQGFQESLSKFLAN